MDNLQIAWKQIQSIYILKTLIPGGIQAIDNDTGFLLDHLRGLDCSGRFLKMGS